MGLLASGTLTIIHQLDDLPETEAARVRREATIEARILKVDWFVVVKGRKDWVLEKDEM